ncbi:MAG: ABC transporter substrate-binding protein [Propionicimonas sp.]
MTLTLWHSSADTQALLDLYTAYEKASGNTIELVDIPNDTYTTAVQTKWATGDRPDLLEYHPTAQDMAQLNMAENMIALADRPFVAAAGELAKSVGQLDGTVYGAVLGPLQTIGLYYNKTALTKAGVTAPTNYDELLTQCPALTKAGVTPLFIGGGSEFPVMMVNGFTYMADFNAADVYGLGVKDGSIKVSDEDSPITAGLQMLTDARDSGCLNKDATTATFQDAIAAVTAGTAAMTVLPSDFIQQFYDGGATDDTIGFGAISAHAGTPTYSASLTGTFFVPKTGDDTKQAAALDFIDWVTSEGYQGYVDAGQFAPTLSTATAPELKGLFADMNAMLSDQNKTIGFNSSIPGFGNFGGVSARVLAGQSTPQQGAEEFQTFIDQARAAQQ